MINKQYIRELFFDKTNINPYTLMGLYVTGSWQYSCTREGSDIDLTAIVKEYPSCGSQFISDDLNVNFYKVSSVDRMLQEGYIPLLEAYYAEDKHIIIKYPKFNVVRPIDSLMDDISLLRVSCSTLTSNSWVKGHKKLTTSDYDLNMALKSIFHSIRIQDFVIQLLDSSTTPDFSSCNYILYDLFFMSESLHREELWLAIKSKYHSVYKQKKSTIKSFIPKESIVSFQRKSDLLEVLKAHNVEASSSLVEDLLNIL